MIRILVPILIFGGIIFVIWALLFVEEDTDYSAYVDSARQFDQECAELSREQLINLYHVNPQRWSFCTEKGWNEYAGRVVYKLTYTGDNGKVNVIVSKKDLQWLRKEYRKYLEHKDLQKQNKSESEGLTEIINTSQNDISKVRAQNYKDMHDALNKAKNIQLKLKEDFTQKRSG